MGRHLPDGVLLTAPPAPICEINSETPDLSLQVYRYARHQCDHDYEEEGDVPEWQLWNPTDRRRWNFVHHIEPNETIPLPPPLDLTDTRKPRPRKPKRQITERTVRKCYEEETIEVWTPPSIDTTGILSRLSRDYLNPLTERESEPKPLAIEYLKSQIETGNTCGHRGIRIQRQSFSPMQNDCFYRVICALDSCGQEHGFDWDYEDDILKTANTLIRRENWSAAHNIIWVW